MRKSILTLGIAAVLTGVLATCSMAYAADDELAQIQESGKLKVGVEGTYPPYTYHDDNGELTGFDVEVTKAIADKENIKLDDATYKTELKKIADAYGYDSVKALKKAASESELKEIALNDLVKEWLANQCIQVEASSSSSSSSSDSSSSSSSDSGN